MAVRWRKVVIVGPGLIGASIGLALRRRRLAEEVVGVGRRAGTLRVARRIGAIDRGTLRLDRAVRGAEWIVICTPVDRIADLLLEAAAHAPTDAILTDAGSCKERIVQRVARAGLEHRCLGSHPLAGSEKSGPSAAQADLFENRLTVVTPTRRSPEQLVRQVEQFWQALGAVTLRMDPREHDRALAGTSHLPHVVAAALAAATPPQDLPLAATGWASTTRVAAGEIPMWCSILCDNRVHVLKSLEKFERKLAAFRKALETDDSRMLMDLLESGKQIRDALGS